MTDTNPTNLRQQMPITAAWIDAMRDAFGVDTINDAIRAGMRGQSGFWASENGFEVGTFMPIRGTMITPVLPYIPTTPEKAKK